MPDPRRPSGPASHLSHLRCCSLVLLMSKQVLSPGRAGRCRKDPARVMCVGESTGVVCPSRIEFVNFSSGLSPDPEAVEMLRACSARDAWLGSCPIGNCEAPSPTPKSVAWLRWEALVRQRQVKPASSQPPASLKALALGVRVQPCSYWSH